MTTRLTLRVAVVIAGAAMAAAAASPAFADDQFGQHVQQCTQTMGFDGVMNPGMHQGYAGWSPDHTC